MSMDNLDFDGITVWLLALYGTLNLLQLHAFEAAKSLVRGYRDFMDWLEEDGRARSVAKRGSAK